MREPNLRIKSRLQGVSKQLRNQIDEEPRVSDELEVAICRIDAITNVYGLQGLHAGAAALLQDRVHRLSSRPDAMVPTHCEWSRPGCQQDDEDAVRIAFALNEPIGNATKHLEAGRPMWSERIRCAAQASRV